MHKQLCKGHQGAWMSAKDSERRVYHVFHPTSLSRLDGGLFNGVNVNTLLRESKPSSKGGSEMLKLHGVGRFFRAFGVTPEYTVGYN